MCEYPHSELSGDVSNAFYQVYNELGYGFLEKGYENVLLHELRKRGHSVVQQMPITVWYDGIKVGDYFADLVVDEVLIVEAKTTERIAPEHEHQLVNYLRATKCEVGLILNFGPEPHIRRKIYQAARGGSGSNQNH